MSETTLPLKPQQPSILLFGLDCQFTASFLELVRQSHVEISAIVLPGPPNMNELLSVRVPSRDLLQSSGMDITTGVLQLAHKTGVSVYRAGNLNHESTLDALVGIKADLLVCACFSRMIPARIHKSFRYGGVNCHPSLLPKLRGPDPVFWTFKQCKGYGGVTLHSLSSRFDSGNILNQRRFGLPDGLTEIEFDTISGKIAGDLLLKTMSDLANGNQDDFPQDERSRSYAPHPTSDDFQIDRSTSAHCAFNFVRGIEGRGIPIYVQYEGRQRVIGAVKGYTDGRTEKIYPEPAIGNVTIEFATGNLIADLI